MLRYKISERAERDMQSVRHWYDQIGRTLGDRVIDAVYDVIRLARERPASFPEISEGTRVARCRRFPYRVYFVVTDDLVNVLAVYHTAREPERWDDPDRD